MPTTDEIDYVLWSLAGAPQLIAPLVREVPAERRKHPPAPGKWSAHEHACHLAEVHPLFFERLERMLAEDDPALAAYYPPADHESGGLLARDLDAELERFGRDRRRLVERLRQLAPADWERTARHPQYSRYDVFVMMRHAAMHDHLHAYRIEEILLEAE